ncbi:neuroblast differentiation-associated protein AHNAK-like isoform X2 [Engraulis encrasicolus]|uniref:neuroblast differentiation-associated protein AHNAK-like isoform X2 n=1 Tax=Engraulis encrasicolus TaxID=184585 RepID=UPI002FD3AB4C
MCDCFHLAFPNWHGGPGGAGAGRRLRGPERETEDDSVCEEPPEFVEGERPRPQGSSPVEEFPAAEKYIEKQGEDDFYDPVHKTGSIKKGKKVGFGSLFCPSGRMSEMDELENGDPSVLVQTAKEACAEGLVVTGGGKDGIFIKELKPDSPASKNLRVKEGDQILSATVYFDNVSYEDALQILEHAQAYKMDLCLKRKPPEPTIQDEAETDRPEGEGGSPKLRGRKPKRQDARISWPKFPSFSKGRKGFKRSHSTSEAEESRKLEMSPTTSDTESPMKSPLKSPDGKEKKKKRLKLKVKMKGLRSKSVEHPSRDDEQSLEILEGVENQMDQSGTDTQSPEKMQLIGEPQVVEQEDVERQAAKAENEYTFPSLTGPEMEKGLHKVELITLDNTLKTTDITAALAEDSQKDKSSPESVKTKERSELRMHIQGKDLLDTVIEGQTKSYSLSQMEQSTIIRTSDASTYDNIVISQSDFSDRQMDINTQSAIQGKRITGHGEMDMSMPKVDVSLDMSDIGLMRKSPGQGTEKQWKEPESYGIRTRGPMADIATSKTTFDSLNGIQFSGGGSATSEMDTDSELKFAHPKAVISQPTSGSLDTSVTDNSKDGRTDIKVSYVSGSPMETSIGKVLADLSTTDGKVNAEFKLPKVAMSDSGPYESVKMTKVDSTRPQLPSREELEIPGMEAAAALAALQIQQMKLPQIHERDDTTLTDEIQTKSRSEIEFNLEDVKALVAKMPTFKLPRIDMSGIHTHREITPDSDKAGATSETSPPELSEAKTDVSLKLPDDTVEVMATPTINIKLKDPSTSIKLPNVELAHLHDHEPITVAHTECSKTKTKLTKVGKSTDMKYKLPKREDIEIPGMEAIVKTNVQIPDVKSGIEIKKPATSPSHLAEGKTETPATETKKEKKDKKSKKSKKSISSLGVTKPDIRFPDTGIELPKKTTSKVTVETKAVSQVDDVQMKGPKATVDIQKPEIAKDISIKGEVDTSNIRDVVDVSASGVTGTVTTDMPKVDISLSQTEVKVDVPGTDIQSKVTMPEVNIDVKSPVGEVEAPEIDSKLKKRKISFPKFSFSKSDAKTVDANVTSPKHTDIDATPPESETKDKNTPESPSKFKLPTLKFPKFGMSSQHGSIDEEETAAIKMPEADIVDVKLPAHDVSLRGDQTIPSVEVSVPDSDTVGKIDVNKPLSITTEGPEVILSISQPDVGIPSVDISIKPSIDLETKEVEQPSAELKAEPVEMEIKSQEGKGFKMPKFGIGMPKVKGPEIDITITKTQVQVPEGKAEVEAEVADASSAKAVIDVPDVDIDLPSVDVKDGPADIDMSVEVEGKDGDVKMKKRFSFPKFGFSRSESKGSDMDAEISKGETTATIADVKETDTKTHESESASKDKGSSPTKFKLPTLKFPKFGMSPTKVQAEGIDVDVVKTIPEEEILEVTVQGHDVSVSGDIATKELKLTASANVDVPATDAEVPETKMETHELDTKTAEGSKFKMPKFGISLPKVKGPEISMSVTKPEVEVSVPEGKLEVKSGDAEIVVPSADAEVGDAAGLEDKGIDIKFKMPQMSLPKIGIAKPEVKATEIDAAPKVDISLSDGEVKIKDDLQAQVKMDITSVEQKVDLKEPDIDIKGPEVELKDSTALSSSPSKFKLPSFKFPKFGVSTPKVKVDTAELTADAKSPEVKLTGLETTMPTLDLSVSARLPETDISMPKVKIDGQKPHVDLDVKVPDMPDMKTSSLQIDPPEANISISAEGPSVSTDIVIPSADVLKEREITVNPGKIELKLPKVEGSALEGDAEITETNVQGPDGGQFKMPKFGISLPKVTVPDLSMSVSKPDAPESEAKIEIKVPDAEIEAPSIETELIQADTKDLDAKMKKRKISFPKFGFSKPEVKAPEVDVTLPKVDISLSGGEIKEPRVDANIAEEPEIKADLEITSPSKFKLPTFKLPKIGVSASKGVPELPEVDAQLETAELKISGSLPVIEGEGPGLEVVVPSLDVSLPEGRVDVEAPKVDVEAPLTRGKVDMPVVDVKMKRPSFSFPKFGLSRAEAKALEVDIPEGQVEVTQTDLDAKISEAEVQLKDANITSPTKFKLPTIKLPKIGVSRDTVEIPTAVDVKAPEVSLGDASFTISGDTPVVEVEGQGMDVKIPDAEVDAESLDMKLKLPKFGISLPKVKGPEVDVSVPKTDVDVSLPEVKADVEIPSVEVKGELPDASLKDINIKVKKPGFSFPKFGFSKPEVKGAELDVSLPKTDISVKGKTDLTLPEVEARIAEGSIEAKDSKGIDMKVKRPSFSFPRFGFSKPDVKASDIDTKIPEVNISLPEATVEVKAPEIDVKVQGDIEQKDANIHTSPSKFKLPTITFPKIGVSAPKVSVEAPSVDVDVKAPEVNLPDLEVKASADVPEVDLKGQTVQTQLPSIDVSTDIEAPEVDGQGSKFKLPSFGISLPKVKGPEFDISVTKPESDVSLPEGKVDVDVTLPEGKMEVPAADAKGAEVKIKKPSFSFPKFGLSKPDVKIPDVEVNVPDVEVNMPDVDLSLPEAKVEIKGPEIDFNIPEGDVEHKDMTIQTSPTKFKLPSFKFPKIGMTAPKGSVEAPSIDVDAKGPDVNLTDAELVSGTLPDIDIQGQNVDVQPPSADVSVDVEGSKFKLPKFGISLSKVKGPEFEVSAEKTDVDVSLSKELDVDVSLPELTAEAPQVDSKGIDVKIKKPSFSFPKFGSSKPEVKVPDMEVNIPEVDISIPEVKMEVKEPEAEIKTPDKNIHTSPSKFKLPTFKMPKIGVSTSKGSIEAPSVDISVKAAEVNLPETELKVSGEVPEVDFKGVDVQPPSIDTDVHVEGPEVESSKMKLPKFGIALPKVKGPEVEASISKPDVDISLPEGTVQVEASLPEGTEVQLEGTEIKMKRGFSFPKFGFSKPDIKAPEVDVSLPKVEVSLPEGKVEVKEAPEGDVQLKDAGAVTSPTKFKLPTFKFPKIGVSAPKTEVDVDVKAPDVSVTDAELKVSVDIPTVDVKGQAVDVEVKAETPEVDTKGIDVKTKRPSFSFPKFGMSKQAVKATDVDVTLPEADVSLPKADIEVQDTAINVEVAESEVELKDTNISGSPSKFKLPTIKFPKFGITAPKVTIETESLDASITKPDINMPDTEGGVAGDVSSVITVPTVDIKAPTVDVNIKTEDVDIKGEGSQFKLPQFGIELPKVKGPEVTVTKTDMTLPEAEVDIKVDGSDAEKASATVKVDLPGVDAKGIAVDIKKPSFSLPKFGFSKPDAKTPEIDTTLPQADMSLPEDSHGASKLDIDVEAEVKDATASGSPSKFKLPTIKLPTFGVTVPKIEPQESDVQGAAEVKMADADIKASASGETTDLDKSEITVEVKPRMSFPKFSFSKPTVKAPEVDLTLPSAAVTLPEESLEAEIDVKAPETEYKDDAATVTSPSKFKLPTIKLPKFGTSPITPTEVEVSLPKVDSSSTVKSSETQDIPAVEGTVASGTSTPTGEGKAIGSPSKFKMPTFKMPKFSYSRTKPEEGAKSPSDAKPEDSPMETGDKDSSQVTDTSPKFTLPTVKDVLQSFDVEFHVPTLDGTDETKGDTPQPGEGELRPAVSGLKQDMEASVDAQEKSKFALTFSTQGLTLTSKESGKVTKTDVTITECTKEEQVLEPQTEQKLQDTKEPQPQSSPEKGSWFKFPKFPSPTKSVKLIEGGVGKTSEEHEQNIDSDNVETDVSTSWSVRSSDAFADDSSAPTTEQIITSPTRVTVKYAEPVSAGTGNFTSKIITSTARTELISMEPDLPEKVNISFSSDSSSVDTLRQQSGAYHIITSNVQTLPNTQQAMLLSGLETQALQSLPLEQLIVKTTTSPWSVQETSTMQEGSIVVEKRIIKEVSGESSETMVITQKTCMLDADSGEPISSLAASSSQALRDIVRTEKMNFFEGKDMPQESTVVTSVVTTEKRVIKRTTEEEQGEK